MLLRWAQRLATPQVSMVPTLRVWSDAQLSAARTYIEMYVLPDAQLTECSVAGARMGEHRGVRFLRWDHGPVEILEDDTPDAAMTAVLEAYNAAEAEHFPS